MSENLIELTDATFDDLVKESQVPVLVDFWAPWCGPCKMLAPMLEELATEYEGKAVICKLDTDDHRDSAIEYGISAVPTIILFNSGEMINKWVGLTSRDDIADALDAIV